jgi:hypothetical protein
MLSSQKVSQFGYYALALSILKGWIPERSFAYLADEPWNNILTEQDTRDMVALKEDLSYKKIGELYGISKGAVFNRVQRFKGIPR